MPDPVRAVILLSLLNVALAACGRPPAEAPPEPGPPPEGVPTGLRVRSAGVEGEYPVPEGAEAPNLTLHLVDGDPETGWHPRGIARLEVGAARVATIEVLHTGIRKLRWRPLHAEGDRLRAGAWTLVDLEQVAPVGTGPWQRIGARPERAVRGLEVEGVEASPEATLSELRLVGYPAAPDDGVRSTRWTAVTSSTPDGPFQLGADQVEAVDPARCTVWVDGAEHRGTEQSCEIDGEQVTIGVHAPESDEETVHRFRIREVGACFGLIDGHPYTRCAPPR